MKKKKEAKRLGRVKRSSGPPNKSFADGLGFMHAGRYIEAIDAFSSAARMRPKDANAWFMLGVAIFHGEGGDRGLQYILRAIELNPVRGDYFYNMGVLLFELRRVEEAKQAFTKAISLTVDNAAAYHNLGIIHNDQGEYMKAFQCYQKAYALNPNLAESAYNIGLLFANNNNHEEAVNFFEQAFLSRPSYFEAYIKTAMALCKLGRSEEALLLLQRNKINRANSGQFSGESCDELIQFYMKISAWEEVPALQEKLNAIVDLEISKNVKTSENPFTCICRHSDFARNFKVARLASIDIANKRLTAGTSFSYGKINGKIILGYLSADFKEHPVAHMIGRLLELHDRERFRVNCYSIVKDEGSETRQRIQASSDKFVDIDSLSDLESSHLINEDQVDILIDLNGYTKNNRIGICALKPAPINVSYLGFSGTTGADFFDYFIADRTIAPPGSEQFFSEKLVYLPDTFFVYDNSQEISGKQWARKEAGLPKTGFVFCSLSNFYKIDQSLFDCWLSILNQVPDSILWLGRLDSLAEKNLKAYAEQKGIASHRIICADKVARRKDFLARLQLADLALDSLIYNGHSTTADFLWAGVPVLTVQGKHVASRIASSILKAARLPEMVVHSSDQYQKLAVELGRDKSKLTAIKEKLALTRSSAPIFDTQAFVDNLESCYAEMIAIHRSGHAPRCIYPEKARSNFPH